MIVSDRNRTATVTVTFMTSTLIRSLRVHRNVPHLRRFTPITRLYLSTTSTSEPQPSPTILLTSPSPETIEEQELDVELVPPQAVNIGITQRAAEVLFSVDCHLAFTDLGTQQLRRISLRENNPDAALRIAVESGGCHGYQYKMDLAPRPAPGD